MNPLTQMKLSECHHHHDEGHITCWETIKNAFHAHEEGESDSEDEEEEHHHHDDIKWY